MSEDTHRKKPAALYRLHEPDGWVNAVAGFEQVVPDLEYLDVVLLKGECPRCKDRMEVELPIEKRTGRHLATNLEDGETLGRPFAKTAICNCREDHQRPKEVSQGCGAFGRLEVGSPDAPPQGIVRVAGKEFVATLADVDWERKAERLEPEELATVRGTGEKWTATATSLTGVFGIVALIKGPDDITKVQGFWEALVIFLVALALALAVVAIVHGAFAAYGMPRQVRPLGGSLRREQAREARKARRYLARSVGLTVAAVFFLTIAIVVTWWKSPDTESGEGKPAATAVLDRPTLASFAGPIEVHRTVPARKIGHLCLVRYTARIFRQQRGGGHWWTSCEEAGRLKTVADVRDRLALPARFGAVRDLRVRARIPKKTGVIYAAGTVAPQCEHKKDEPPCQGRRYSGGADQYYFPNANSPDRWIVERSCSRKREDEPSAWFRCSG